MYRTAASSGTSSTLSISPRARASTAVTRRPVKNISIAAASPISRGKRWVPPHPVIMPRVAPGCENKAFGLAIRRSHASARSSAPPKQNPLTAATVGQWSDATFDINVCPRRANSFAVSAVTAAISRRSAPDANTSPVPVNNSPAAAESAATASIAPSPARR